MRQEKVTKRPRAGLLGPPGAAPATGEAVEPLHGQVEGPGPSAAVPRGLCGISGDHGAGRQAPPCCPTL